MNQKNIFLITALFLFLTSFSQKNKIYDIVIYGANSAGIMAAVEASASGKSVIVINPGGYIGGLTTGGLGWTDIGNKMVIGGLSREFYQKIKNYYEHDENWKWEEKANYTAKEQSQQSNIGKDAMWTFEPSAATAVFDNYIKEYKIKIVNERLKLRNGVIKRKGIINALKMESGKKYRGKIYIDATYEGDLMAGAGVSYTFGREAASQYGEDLNGVQTARGIYHQFPDGIDPYIQQGNKASGLLPQVNPFVAAEKSSDKMIQAYCFRMCVTDVPENRITIKKPDRYNELEYELLFRYIDMIGAQKATDMFTLSKMPNRKTDSNNKGPFSLDYIGKNYNYPEGTYKQREQIIKEHKDYQLGLLWTLQHHARIPQSVRDYYSKWGLPRDEYISYNNFTPQLYIREARRMVSDYVMTQNHCMQKGVSAEQSIGMGAYTMDSHHVQRYVNSDGHVKNEGDVQVGGFRPYPIDYRSIIPKENECENLLVPVCLSASHMAYGSIRMEPVFMILGQSAAAAAVIAVDNNSTVQNVDYKKLQKVLLKRKMVLEYK